MSELLNAGIMSVFKTDPGCKRIIWQQLCKFDPTFFFFTSIDSVSSLIKVDLVQV